MTCALSIFGRENEYARPNPAHIFCTMKKDEWEEDRHGISLLRIMQSRLRGALSTTNNDDPLRSLLEHHRQIMKSSTALLLFRHRSASQRMAFSVIDSSLKAAKSRVSSKLGKYAETGEGDGWTSDENLTRAPLSNDPSPPREHLTLGRLYPLISLSVPSTTLLSDGRFVTMTKNVRLTGRYSSINSNRKNFNVCPWPIHSLSI
ncbi:hypothetical protein WUBG_01356 [Wuchereria bancrofti]|uniref:Uncharacterized protein n=1 Tax=Wuchereria bancrofti TaxID=6293 RepID=J9FK60_WUCBA|nr:hypothetical protein WUBG_01356 [Wuchereria bancrofti]